MAPFVVRTAETPVAVGTARPVPIGTGVVVVVVVVIIVEVIGGRAVGSRKRTPDTVRTAVRF